MIFLGDHKSFFPTPYPSNTSELVYFFCPFVKLQLIRSRFIRVSGLNTFFNIASKKSPRRSKFQSEVLQVVRENLAEGQVPSYRKFRT